MYIQVKRFYKVHFKTELYKQLILNEQKSFSTSGGKKLRDNNNNISTLNLSLLEIKFIYEKKCVLLPSASASFFVYSEPMKLLIT